MIADRVGGVVGRTGVVLEESWVEERLLSGGVHLEASAQLLPEHGERQHVVAGVVDRSELTAEPVVIKPDVVGDAGCGRSRGVVHHDMKTITL